MTDSYPFTRPFEVAVAVATASNRVFYETIGAFLVADKMPSKDAQLLVASAQYVVRKSGSTHSGVIAATQRLRYLMHKGEVDQAQLDEVHAMVQLAEDVDALADVDALIAEVVPAVKRIAHQDALEQATLDYGKTADSEQAVEDAARNFDQIASLGQRKVSTAESLSGTAEDIAACVATEQGSTLPTGIEPLDLALHGGLGMPGLGMFMAASGDGKSFFLCGVAVEALLLGYDVVYITLEIQPKVVKNRVYRNLYDMTERQLRDQSHIAARRHAELVADGIGKLEIVYEAPGVTSVNHIRQRVRTIEQDSGMRVRVVVIDYADLLIANRGGKDASLYTEMKYVYHAMADYAVEINGAVMTASQTNRQAIRSKHVGQKAVADSLHKIRSPDLIISAVRTEEDVSNDVVRFEVPKRRHGEPLSSIGPLPIDWDHGRMTCVTARKNPWA